MAKHKGRRRFRRYIKGTVDFVLALSTLGGNTLVGAAVGDSVIETTWLSSVKATWSLHRVTPAETVGPVLVGLAHSDYTDSEIEQFIENSGGWSEGNKVSQEIARRKIRIVGTLTPAELVTLSSTLADGRAITTKCGWYLATGQTIRFWAYNQGSAAFSTTIPTVHINGHANLWPR